MMLPALAGWFAFVTLGLIAGIHVYWGFGGLWPATSEPELVRTVVGISHASTMPPSMMTFGVAGLIFVAAAFGLARGVLGFDHLLFVRIPVGVIALVMLARGVYAYLPGPFARATEPFASLNATIFSPLILILALTYAYLALAPAQA